MWNVRPFIGKQNLGHFLYNSVIESTALSNLRNYSMLISGFHHQIMSGSLMRLE